MKLLVLCYALVLMLAACFFVFPAFSQENTTAAQAQEAIPQAVKEEAPLLKELSVYGEVQAVNAAANTITVQYYDYDSDQEKTADVTVDKDTKIENVTGIDKIAKGDWVDVTYSVKESKNVALSLIVEKEEPEAPVAEKVASETPMGD